MSGPLVLSLDTSHRSGSVALLRGPDLLGEILFDASDTHSATLMPAIEACCAGARVAPAEVDRFVVVIGPGSFTGLRIGLATVKGLAAVRRRPVTPVGSLETLAAALPFAAFPVMPLIDARRGEVYAALYDTSSGVPLEMETPRAVSPGDVGSICRGPVIACGTGVRHYHGQIVTRLPAGSLAAGPRWEIPSASLAALLAEERVSVPYDELAPLEPLYIRPPDAKLPPSAKLLPGGGR
jgi:tRNA threonylcarbamoyladenosine biosynthesis protein TsaB